MSNDYMRTLEEMIYRYGNLTADLKGEMVKLDMQTAALQSRIDSAQHEWLMYQQLWEEALRD